MDKKYYPNLKTELARPEYEGLDHNEKAAKLNLPREANAETYYRRLPPNELLEWSAANALLIVLKDKHADTNVADAGRAICFGALETITSPHSKGLDLENPVHMGMLDQLVASDDVAEFNEEMRESLLALARVTKTACEEVTDVGVKATYLDVSRAERL